jgi:hypothetical protein
MPKTPSSRPTFAAPCDARLPEAALQFRLQYSPPLTTSRFLGGFNVTAWLYRDKSGAEDIRVDLNTTIAELNQRFGPAETPDAEVGFHSEMHASDWFRTKHQLQVLQIFSERIPCPKMCGPMLRTYFRGVPWYYYFDRESWRGTNRRAADILRSAYDL